MKAALSAALLVAATVAIALPADAARRPRHAPAAAERITRLVIYGNDPCPRGQNGEIVVCARRPDKERYRIPQALRDRPSDDPASQSWAARSESLEYVGRTGIQSCSTVGPGGFTGCWTEMMRNARQDRAAAGDAPRR
jgi:hypothetical protein